MYWFPGYYVLLRQLHEKSRADRVLVSYLLLVRTIQFSQSLRCVRCATARNEWISSLSGSIGQDRGSISQRLFSTRKPRCVFAPENLPHCSQRSVLTGNTGSIDLGKDIKVFFYVAQSLAQSACISKVTAIWCNAYALAVTFPQL